MRIVSTFLPAGSEELAGGKPTVLFAFDTLVGDKNLVAGLTVGRVAGPTLQDVTCSEVGLKVIERCAGHHQLNYPQGLVVLAGVAQVASAPERVRKVLTQAPDGAFVLLVCTNGKVYDAAFKALNVDLQALNEQPRQ